MIWKNYYSLEDTFGDIINKAQSGLKISDEELCEKAGISSEQLNKAQIGQYDHTRDEEEAVKKIATVLKLDPENLFRITIKKWMPEHIEIKGVKQYTSKYFHMTVNTYAVWDPQTLKGVIFDTGTHCWDMNHDIWERNVRPELLLLTHAHADHIREIKYILQSFPDIKIYIHKDEFIDTDEDEYLNKAEPITEGIEFKVGNLTIQTRKTYGHTAGGLTYVIHGLEKPVAVIGDTIFAGSIGRPLLSYEDAMRTNKKEILSLPDDTILCPGHGPMTTVAEEKKYNPFFSLDYK